MKSSPSLPFHLLRTMPFMSATPPGIEPPPPAPIHAEDDALLPPNFLSVNKGGTVLTVGRAGVPVLPSLHHTRTIISKVQALQVSYSHRGQ